MATASRRFSLLRTRAGRGPLIMALMVGVPEMRVEPKLQPALRRYW